ncbi:hypothetical protein AAFF_G00353880 [Aldrovandia affinis]|uniref:Peptidase A2 domain-containing protein n=1 Tax=Aldrovandia affinis TaxID=143900 RepID=A0AAD7SIE0_9TELE|nr:hypothetical protein AAFF_G00353880 [Aldrovandia affinis]
MNQFQVTPPEKFTFKSDDWPKWIKRFDRFHIASGLETQADENQVNSLIYTMGKEAEDILVSLHLSPVCRTKKMHEVNVATVTEPDTDDGYEVAFLGSMTADAGDSPWMTEVKMDNHNTVFKIDTGADVTAVPETLYTQGQFSTLERATLVLKGPGRVPLKVKGKFTATLSKRNKTTKEDIYVVEGLSTPLLSRPAATALQLVARLEDVSLDSKETIKQEFPKLFSGLGKMEEIATADVLSRLPVDSTTEGLREEEINLYADSVIASLPATEKRLREIQTHQVNDDILRQVKQYCVEGWPDKFSIGRVFQPYLPFSAEL